ncbi:MFS general substrate transporter [Pleurotus eryngii]|uniref:MFS general substrate transporter n=1 Tax=Pleurotus eryngii TaxID=5323 RepID=A0A9P5ZTN4_PLEER|nr:MFS general substrate transporter [Pleurotus eryngii]
MASITPRASVFWEDSRSMASGYFSGDDDSDGDSEQQSRLLAGDDRDFDDRTRLDKTIDRIGMGSYQWTLLSLCGLGWMADNMWIQAIAIILPRVQRHYSVPDSYVGALSSSMFAGMMFGAVGWGACSDLMGRSAAFNATLFFTAVFGLLASFSRSFPSLCVLLFLLGSSVGGSMPTDGTLLLEHMPKGKQYLVTALSVFFSFGAVLSAVVALLVVPQHSCQSSGPCDPDVDNVGWQYLLMTLGTITLSMFLARMVFFKLHESPRFLVHAGRPQEALESLQLISRFNGSDLTLMLDDVDDQRPERISSPQQMADEQSKQIPPTATHDSSSTQVPIADYQATGEATVNLESHSLLSSTDPPTSSQPSPTIHSPRPTRPFHDTDKELGLPPSISPRRESRFTFTDPAQAEATDPAHVTPPARPRPRPTHRLSQASTRSRRRSSFYDNNKYCGKLPRWLRKPLLAWLDRVGMVLTPEWLRTTLLVWAAWCSMSLAYTMFNVFLPKLLESSGTVGAATGEKTLEASLWDVVIFTIGGCPGAILGAYMIESPLGRRWSLASSTFVTAFFCVIFVGVESPWAVRASTVGISLSATAMWAVLYGWTPEIFTTKVRGTACGIASALSRIGGMIAPMLGGVLLMIDRSVPVYTSVVTFVLAGCCVLFLRGDSPEGASGAVRSILH